MKTDKEPSFAAFYKNMVKTRKYFFFYFNFF